MEFVNDDAKGNMHTQKKDAAVAAVDIYFIDGDIGVRSWGCLTSSLAWRGFPLINKRCPLSYEKRSR